MKFGAISARRSYKLRLGGVKIWESKIPIRFRFMKIVFLTDINELIPHSP